MSRRIRITLGDLPVEVPSQLIHDALEEQAPEFLRTGDNLDAKAKALRLGLKAIARGALSYAESQIIRAGSNYPRPDYRLARADTLGYALGYFLDMILYGLSSVDWIAQYEDTDTGAVEITGLVTAPSPGSIAGESAGSTEPGSPEESQGTEPVTGESERALVSGGHNGLWQNDIRQETDSGAAATLA